MRSNWHFPVGHRQDLRFLSTLLLLTFIRPHCALQTGKSMIYLSPTAVLQVYISSAAYTVVPDCTGSGGAGDLGCTIQHIDFPINVPYPSVHHVSGVEISAHLEYASDCRQVLTNPDNTVLF